MGFTLFRKLNLAPNKLKSDFIHIFVPLCISVSGWKHENRSPFADENNTTTASASVKSGSDYQRRPFSRSSSKGGVGAASTTSSRPPSAFENHIDYFREPVVKSPPEPTRVKSPEAVVRSPDPINWTVPLDTGKTFSVTQSIKDGGMMSLALGKSLLLFILF